MVQFKKNLYTTEKINNVELIKFKVRVGMGITGIYFLGISNGSRNLEIVPAAVFKQRLMRKVGFIVTGIGHNKGAALNLTGKIAEDTYRSRGDYNIYEYVRSIK